MANPTSTTSGGVYLDFAEVWPWLQMDFAPTGTAQFRLQRLIDGACQTAQECCARPIAPTQFQERHDGWAGEYIVLHHSPFLSLVSCIEWQSSGGPITLPESTPENPVEGIQIDYATSKIMRAFQGYSWPRPFFPGSRNIEITYIAGFDPVPPDLWMATADLVAYWWRMSQESPRWYPSSGDEYGGPETSALYPGVPNRIAEVFERYRLPTIG